MGNIFLVGDFAGIEMRVDLALAGQHDKCEMLRLSDTGEKPVDIYLDMAEKIYNQPPGTWNVPDASTLKRMKEEHLLERTIGKNTVLGCGFQMGAPKFHARYCPDQPIEFAERVVKAYREQFAPKVVQLWGGLNAAALAAVLADPSNRMLVRSLGAEEWQIERAFQHGPEYHGVRFALERFAGNEWLTALMPSGRKLWYHAPAIGLKKWTNGGVSIEVKYRNYAKQGHAGGMSAGSLSGTDMVNDLDRYRTGKDQWIHVYGGMLTENVVQALARDLLVAAMFRLEENGFPVVLTVHDEIVCEVPAALADLKAFKETTEVRPAWAVDLGIPIAIEEWAGERYRK